MDNLPGAVPLETTELPERACLVFGSEGPGLTPELAALCDPLVAITQYGSTRSLNAGAAAAIAMYHWALRWARWPSLTASECASGSADPTLAVMCGKRRGPTASRFDGSIVTPILVPTGLATPLSAQEEEASRWTTGTAVERPVPTLDRPSEHRGGVAAVTGYHEARPGPRRPRATHRRRAPLR